MAQILQDTGPRNFSTFIDRLSRPEVIDLVRAAQAPYDADADTYGAFGLSP